MKPLLSMCLLMGSVYAVAQPLGQAIQNALITNPALLFNTSKTLTDKQRIDVAKGAYYPSIDIRGSFGREESENPTTLAIDGSSKRTLDRRESDIELTQNLFAGGGIVNEVRRNQYFYESQLLKTQGIAEDLALNVVERYLNVLKHERLYGLAKKNYSEHKKVFGLIQERRDAGLAKEAELYQANSRLALAESNKINAFANLREMKIMYAKVVGRWPSQLRWPDAPKSAALPQNLGKAIEYGMEHHPTIRASYADIKEAKAQYQVSRAAYYPRVDAVLQASHNRNLSGLIGPNNNRLAAIRASYNVFRGGADYADVKRTAYQVQEAFEVKNQALIDLRELLRLSWNAWVTTGERLRPLKSHVYNARKTRGAYAEQFKLGKRTLLDLLDSQNEFYQAQINLVEGKNDELFARYRILNGMGQLLHYFELKIPENVKNNDIFTSAQRQIITDDSMDGVPYPDNTDNQLELSRSVPKLEHTAINKKIVNKNAAMPEAARPEIWYVSAGIFSDKKRAIRLNQRLQSRGFSTFVYNTDNQWSVLLGPFEYRGHAANSMTRLKEIAKVKGRLVTFKDEDIAMDSEK